MVKIKNISKGTANLTANSLKVRPIVLEKGEVFIFEAHHQYVPFHNSVQGLKSLDILEVEATKDGELSAEDKKLLETQKKKQAAIEEARLKGAARAEENKAKDAEEKAKKEREEAEAAKKLAEKEAKEAEEAKLKAEKEQKEAEEAKALAAKEEAEAKAAEEAKKKAEAKK